jgi:hypothetical protein
MMRFYHRRTVMPMRFVLLIVATIPAAASTASEEVERTRTQYGPHALHVRPASNRSPVTGYRSNERCFVRRLRGLVCCRTPMALDFGVCCPANDDGVAAPKWISLFDGNSLDGWIVANFGGEGEVRVDDRRIVLDFGEMLTGITYQRDFPASNYEVQFQAMRIDGIDFFCGLTFPVGKTHCSLIAGGWAGAVVGLSCIDGRDASENETTKYMNFENGRWYTFRVRVTDDRIAAWIDDGQVVDQRIGDHTMNTRPEMELSKPLGIAAWQTRSALRHLVYRLLD